MNQTQTKQVKIILILILNLTLVSSSFKVLNKTNKVNINPSAKEETSLTSLNNLLALKSNVLIIFHADWCGHCKKFLPIFEEISKNDQLSKAFSFIKVTCNANSDICQSFNISKYPTLKVFLNGVEYSSEPSREKAELEEFLYKVNEDVVVNINNKKELDEFRSLYGEVSFLIYSNDDKEDKSLLKSDLVRLSNDHYIKANFYIGLVKDKSLVSDFITNSLKINSKNDESQTEDEDENDSIFFLISNGKITKKQIKLLDNKEGNFNKIKEFIITHEFSSISHASLSFLKRITEKKRQILIFSLQSEYEIDLVIREIDIIYNKKNSLLLTYIVKDLPIDEKIFHHFRMKSSYEVIIYDMKHLKYVQNEEMTKNIDLKEMISQVKQYIHMSDDDLKELKYISSNLLEYILNQIGLEFNSINVIGLVVLGIVTLFLFLFGLIFFCEKVMVSNENEGFTYENKEIQKGNLKKDDLDKKNK